MAFWKQNEAAHFEAKNVDIFDWENNKKLFRRKNYDTKNLFWHIAYFALQWAWDVQTDTTSLTASLTRAHDTRRP